MKTHVQVAVIGGGVVGASVLYHLTKFGWRDVVLLERNELTCGSTWHAAGGMHTLNGDPNVARLQQYTIGLYKELEELTGQSCGLHMPGGLMLADSAERMDWLRMAVARGRYLGMDLNIISMDEAAKLAPLMDKSQFFGALHDPLEGHVDPYGVTHAYAKAARMGGAEIYLKTKVESLAQRPDGSWNVSTNQGELVAEHVVNAGGLWAREVGRMVGIELPVLAMEHQYLITDDIAALPTDYEFPHCIDFGGEIYLRQERRGMLLGTYEQNAVPWSPKTTPWAFSAELLPPDLDRIADQLEIGFRHFPALAEAGIKTIINGPFTFAPDGNPLVGPVRGLRNFWVACGVMAGFSQGGGVGLSLAQWMIHGDPGADIFGMDVARYGDWTSLAWTNAKVRENYGRRFRVTYPNEELPTGRPLRTTPVYGRLKERGAVFGTSFGLEYPLWFAPEGTAAREEITFRRSNAHGPVAAECFAVRNAVGLLETSGYAKYEISGAGAEAFLGRVLAGKIPEVGRIALTPMLNAGGKLIGDFTVACLSSDIFNVFGSGPAEEYHLRWWMAHAGPGVSIRSLRSALTGLSIAGPRSRELLGRLAEADVSNDAMPFLSYRRMVLGMVPALVGRISFTGDLGYEIWVTPDVQPTLYAALTAAGADLGLRDIGLRALNSLRLDKAFGTWAHEYRPIYGPKEAGLGRFISYSREGFVGRDAALRERDEGGKLRLVTLLVDADDADALGDEPVLHEGRAVGWVTSGGYAHTVQQSVALAYVPKDLPSDGLSVEVLGVLRRAIVTTDAPFDPAGTRMRG